MNQEDADGPHSRSGAWQRSRTSDPPIVSCDIGSSGNRIHSRLAQGRSRTISDGNASEPPTQQTTDGDRRRTTQTTPASTTPPIAKQRLTEFGEQSGTTDLDLSECALIYLPTEIKTLGGSVESLHLERNYLVTLPPELGALSCLTTLQLFQNELLYLPREIGMLSNLTRLFVNRNHLKQLPPEIGQLKRLVWLSLDNNQLHGLPDEIGSLSNLAWLSIESNSLESLPLSMGSLYNLKSLSLYGNDKIASLPYPLLMLPQLNDVRLNVPCKLPKDVVQMGPSHILNYLVSLERLELRLDPGSTVQHWQPDEQVSACKSCCASFSKITRRHHCRFCGFVLCKKCTGKRSVIPYLLFYSPVRVCDQCSLVLTTSASSGITTTSITATTTTAPMSTFSAVQDGLGPLGSRASFRVS
eukprot:TRINITY_DN4628_c0_g1_i2.p1 TRINITY_DN4628_c0_g1~~TRINITY_DN4628_c0_g1_i2.p1  ORF type:complete len:413 (+),score=34.48 TRINITY_DN4628_c0_g1_i2:29-1267(+)